MMFVKLTQWETDYIYIKASAILAIAPLRIHPTSTLSGSEVTTGEYSYNVKETVTEVLNLIGAIVK